MPLTPVKMYRGANIHGDAGDESKWLDCLVNLDQVRSAETTPGLDVAAVTLRYEAAESVHVLGTLDDLLSGGKAGAKPARDAVKP